MKKTMIIPFTTAQQEKVKKQAYARAEIIEKIFENLLIQFFIFTVAVFICLFIFAEDISYWYLLLLLPIAVVVIIYCVSAEKIRKLDKQKIREIETLYDVYKRLLELRKMNRYPEQN